MITREEVKKRFNQEGLRMVHYPEYDNEEQLENAIKHIKLMFKEVFKEEQGNE